MLGRVSPCPLVNLTLGFALKGRFAADSRGYLAKPDQHEDGNKGRDNA